MWHDRFSRLIIRNLPNMPDVLALDVHCGSGRTTGELLHRLGAGAKVLAIDPDEGAIELAKTRIRPEWKNRVYFKPGHFDDVTAMADDSYNLVVANLVLGESVDLSSALSEMIRVSKIGGRVLATVPLHGTWDEVEDIFAEILRDAGMTAALRRLEALRAIRPTGPQLGGILRKLGVETDDYVVESERFQLIFPSGREFLFAPVIEHGPLQMWKAVIGKDGTPQELFWRLKEAIDTYYAGHVLAVTAHAGLVHVEVAKGTARPGPRLAARFWRHYPDLDKLWGGLAVGYARVSDPLLNFSEDDVSDFDLDIDLDESDPRRRTGAVKALRQPTGKNPVVTPSPEDFGFRPRGDAGDSGTRPVVDAESSGTRKATPGSEASGLRALSRLRDDGEASGMRPAAKIVGDGETSGMRPARAASESSGFRPVAPPVDEDDFSELNSRTGPVQALKNTPVAAEDDFSDVEKTGPHKVVEPEPVAEDDFSDVEKTGPHKIVESAPTPEDDFSEVSKASPAPKPEPVPAAADDDDDAHPPAPRAEPEPEPVEPRRPLAASARAAEPEPPTDTSEPARPAADLKSAEPKPEPVKPALPSFKIGERPTPSGGPSMFRAPTFKPPTESKPEPETKPAESKPAAESKPEPKPEPRVPIRSMFRPPEPAPAPPAEDEPEEEVLEDVESMEELEPEPAPAAPSKPPPPKPAPPPLGLRPRPLAPIFVPPDKKK